MFPLHMVPLKEEKEKLWEVYFLKLREIKEKSSVLEDITWGKCKNWEKQKEKCSVLEDMGM